MSNNNALPPDVRARLDAIRQRAKCAAYYEQCDIPGTENPDQASKDIDELLELVDTLLPPAPTAAGAAEPGNAATWTARLVMPDELPMKWWHLPEFGAFMAVDTEDQRDNSYGPFDTREEAQADWLKVISSPPPDGAS